jgi:nucleoside-diphosphate-sugar epimerase
MLLALTGATGFIGQYLLRELPKRGYRVRVLLRRPTSLSPQSASAVIGDLARPRNMSAALEGADAVIHSTGRVCTVWSGPITQTNEPCPCAPTRMAAQNQYLKRNKAAVILHAV